MSCLNSIDRLQALLGASHQALIGSFINGIITPGGPTLDPLRLIIVRILAALWMNQALADTLTSIV